MSIKRLNICFQQSFSFTVQLSFTWVLFGHYVLSLAEKRCFHGDFLRLEEEVKGFEFCSNLYVLVSGPG